MLSELIEILKFITDDKTRQTVQMIGQVASNREKNWSKNIQTMKGKFSARESAKVNAFANALFTEIEKTGITDEKLSIVKTVFTELVNNAFRHGCKYEKKCKISINSIFSKWFVEMEVRDEGKGFNVEEILNAKRVGRRTGLQLVNDLADNLVTNSTGNVVTVLVASGNRINVETKTLMYDAKALDVITLSEEEDWYFLSPNWFPLQKALNEIVHDNVLVTWKTGIQIYPLDTCRLGKLIEVTTGCHITPEKNYAFVVHSDWILQDLQEAETNNLKFFSNLYNARRWLFKKMGVSPVYCHNCDKKNLETARFCRFCGNPLSIPEWGGDTI